MIEPMKKVSVVLLNKEREDALKSLRKIGLVHLEKLEGSSEKLSAFKEASANATVTESVLGEIKLPKKSKGDKQLLSNEETAKLCAEVVAKADSAWHSPSDSRTGRKRPGADRKRSARPPDGRCLRWAQSLRSAA